MRADNLAGAGRLWARLFPAGEGCLLVNVLKSDIVASTDAAALRGIIDEQMKDLPTLPIVVAKILQTASSPTASARELQALIAVDGGLTAKILRLANSAFYGHSRTITTLSDAVVVLGFNSVRNLTLSASMLDSLAPRGAAQIFDWRAYWVHCNAVALCARLIARRKKLSPAACEEAFIAGLLHDIGKLFLGKYCPDLLAEVVLTAETYGVPMVEAEWRLMGTTHALLGQQIAERWNFPAPLASAIGAHHDPDAWQGDKTLTYVVHAANVWTQWAGLGAVDPATPRLHNDVDEWIPLTSVEREDLIEQLRADMEKTQALLGWDDDDGTGGRAPLPADHSGDDAAPPAAEGENTVSASALAMASASTLSHIQDTLIEAAGVLLPLWGSTLFLWDDESDRFRASSCGQANDVLTRIGEQQMRESLLDKVLSPHTAAGAPVVVAAPRSLAALARGHRFLLSALLHGPTGKTVGFLLLGQSAEHEFIAQSRAAEALGNLCRHAAAGIVRLQGFRASVAALATAIDARDPSGGDHSRRVRDFSLACGRHLKLSPPRLERLEIAALLHDVGKIGVPEHILNKPGRLEPDEFGHIAAHAQGGAHLAGHTFGEVMPFILCHHERWDGSGYPAGLKGAQIPMEAQILAVCEAWDAMRSGQAFRDARSVAEAQRELIEGSGTQFNPLVVEAFLASVADAAADRSEAGAAVAAFARG